VQQVGNILIGLMMFALLSYPHQTKCNSCRRVAG